MRRLLKAQIWIASALALCACLYVRNYDWAGYWRVVDERGILIRLADLLLNLQSIMFIVPVCGALIALKYGRSQHLGRLLLVAELLYIFSVAWPLVAIFVWECQEVPLVNTVAGP